ncbi:MAG: carboxypeptidase regulatory-like domain-containing protein [Planctomycetota bacterium]
MSAPRAILLFLLLAAPAAIVFPGRSPSPPLPAPSPPAELARGSDPRLPAALQEPAPPAARRAVNLAVPAGIAAPATALPSAVQQLASGGTAHLEVLVLASDCRPLPAASVELRQGSPLDGAEELQLARTGDAGRVTVALHPGPLAIVAWSERGIGGPLAVELAAGWNGTVEVVVAPAREVRGRIRDARSGAPIAGASISFWCTSTLDRVLSAADGTFHHPRFPAGELAQQIRVEAAGYGPAVRYLRVDPGGEWEFPSATAAGGETVHAAGSPWIEIELHPEVRLRGRVVDPGGRPIAGAAAAAEGYYLVLSGVASRDGAEALTGAGGEFVLAALRSDISHSLAVRAPGYAERRLELPAASLPEQDLGTIILAPELLVAGVVVDPAGRPVEDIAVELVPLAPEGDPPAEGAAPPAAGESELDVHLRAPSRSERQRTDAGGAFLFAGLVDREYELFVARDGDPLVVERVRPGDAAATRLLLALPATSLVLAGEVRDADGPVAGARVEVWRHAAVGAVLTDEHGRFHVAGLDDRAAYRLTCLAADPGGLVRRVQTVAWAFEAPVLLLGPAARESLALRDE